MIRIAPDGRKILRIEGDEHGGFPFPNDLAFGPDGHLYLTDFGLAVEDFLDGRTRVAVRRRVPLRRVRHQDTGSGAVRQRAAARRSAGFLGPDGMAFGANGRLYCAVSGQRNVTVPDQTGVVADRLLLDGPCLTDGAFALAGNTLLVTEVGKGQVEAGPCGSPSGLTLPWQAGHPTRRIDAV